MALVKICTDNKDYVIKFPCLTWKVAETNMTQRPHASGRMESNDWSREHYLPWKDGKLKDDVLWQKQTVLIKKEQKVSLPYSLLYDQVK